MFSYVECVSPRKTPIMSRDDNIIGKLITDNINQSSLDNTIIDD